MPPMKTTTDYACNLRGIGQLAIDRIREARASHEREPDDAIRMILTGRAQAYSEVLLLLTGHRDLDRAEEYLAWRKLLADCD